MTKFSKIVFFLFLSFKSFACDDSSFSLLNQTNNGDGTYTYEIELCNQMLGLEGIPDGFELAFSGGTFTNVIGFNPSSLFTSGSDEYIGSIEGVGTSVLWELQTIFPIHNSNLFCNTITITTQGEPTTIDVDYHQGYPGCTDQFTFPSIQCEIELIAGNQTPCDPSTNTYTQEVIVTYSNAPTTGTLDINGQSFPISSSPQTITLTGLVANGNIVNVDASFSVEQTCSITSNGLFTAPVACTCGASTGDITITGGTLVGTNEYDLTNCETITFTASNEDLNVGVLTYGWAVFNCEPNLPFTAGEILDFNNNPCYLGSDYGLTTNDIDAGGISGTISGGYNALWIVPYTSDVANSLDANGDACYDFGAPIQINYLPPSCGTCDDPTCAVGSVNTFEDRTYLLCNNPCADLNDLTYITYHTVTTDGFGNIGVVQQLNFSQSFCTELTRSAVLRDAANSCGGPDIAPSILNANGVGSGFNPEWFGLIPSTNYTLIVTTVIGSDCNYDFGCIDFYGIPGCAANIGNTTIETSNVTNNDFILCFNESIDLSTTGYTLPTGGPNENIGYALYTCQPTTNNPATDPCFTGQYVIGAEASSINDGTFAPALTATNQTIWLTPITMDMAVSPIFNHDADADGCYTMGTPIQITYLNPIQTSDVIDCSNESVTVTINGGYPEFFTGNYNLTNTGNGILNTSTLAASGGTVIISGLTNGDSYSFTIEDDNDCPQTFSGNFICVECEITDLSAVVLTCDPIDNTYSADITVTYFNPALSGTLDIYAPAVQSFAITSSQQTVSLTGLIADGQTVDISAQFSDDASCTYSELALFTAPSVPDLIITDPEAVCTPESIDLLAPELTAGSTGGVSLTYWTDASLSIPLTNQEAVTVSGTYFIQSESALGCIAFEAVNVLINQIPNPPSVSEDQLYCNNEEILALEAQGSAGSYTWYSDENLTQVIGNAAQYLPENTIGTSNYYVTATENNCESQSVQVVIEIEECNIIIPTAFTPDGDFANDKWNIENIDLIYPENVVSIYNRWGNKIYESQPGSYNSNQWDGRYKGETLPVATYYYIIEYNDQFTEATQGIVSLLK